MLCMRLVVAGRLSQKSTGQTGLDSQDEDARKWAVEAGHTVVYTAADHISGRVPASERPKLGPWLNDPELIAMYDGILFSKMDRATRARDWSIRTWAEANNKKLIVVSPELTWPPKKGDVATPIIWDDLVNIAAAEWEQTSLRYLRMQKALRDQAFFVGKPPYGYKIVLVDGTDHKTLIPHPVTSVVVKRMASLYLDDGWSLGRIAAWLNEHDYPMPQPPKGRTGKGWTAVAVRRTLRNQAIAGRLQCKGKTVLRIEAIIPVEDFRKIQDLMSSRATRIGPGAQSTALLTGMAVCQNGKPMYRVQGRKIPSNPDGLYYYCRECPKGERLLVPMSYLDGVVNDAVMSLGDLPHRITQVIPGDDYADEISVVRQEISELDPESDDYDTSLSRLRSELAHLRSLPSKPPEIKQNADGRTVREVWESLDTAGRRKWLLSRNGSEWLPEDTRASVRVMGSKTDDGTWPVVVDLGEYTM